MVGDVGLDLEATAGGAGAGGAEERSMVPSAALGGGGGDLLSRGIPMLCLFSLSWPSLRVGGLGVEEAHGRGREKRRVRKKKRGKTLPFLRRSSGKRPRASLALTLLTFFRLPKKKTPSRLKTDSFPETGRCFSLLFLCVSQVRPYFSPSPCTKVGAEEELRGRRTEARFYEFAFSLLDARGAPLLRRRSIAPSRRPLTAGLAWPPSLALCPNIFVQGRCVVEMRQLGKKIETLGSFEEHASEGAEDARADRRASSRCSRSLLLLAKKNDASSILSALSHPSLLPLSFL